MNKETQIDLMAPRYKVIADYPYSIFNVGQVIEFNSIRLGMPCYEYATNEGVEWEYEDDFFKRFTTIFQPLPWYAERSVEDMPEYVKLVHPDYHYSVQKVVKWNEDGSSLITEDWDQYQSLKVFQPATLEEYQSFKQLKP